MYVINSRESLGGIATLGSESYAGIVRLRQHRIRQDDQAYAKKW